MAYDLETQGLVGRMDSVVVQALRCTLSQMNDFENWTGILPLVELAISF